jgi:hypothetical protein
MLSILAKVNQLIDEIKDKEYQRDEARITAY